MSGVPIKMIKKDEFHSMEKTVVGKGNVAGNEIHEPQVQLVEVGGGAFDIIVTCKCGEKTTVRCNSLDPVKEVPPQTAVAPVSAALSKKSDASV